MGKQGKPKMPAKQRVTRYNTLQQPPLPNTEFNSKTVKLEFARRLQSAMIRKGWNQSELSRRASAFLPKPTPGQKRGHSGIGRDLISHYIRGLMLPGPANLNALAQALGVEPADLMPTVGQPQIGDVPLEVKAMDGDRMYLRIARSVSTDTAMKIMQLLREEDAA